MDSKPGNPQADGPKKAARRRAKTTDLAPGEPALQAPWNEGSFQPVGSEQAVMESLGPAVSSLLEFEHALLAAIMAPLAEAESNLQAIDDHLRTQIGAALLPAVSALSQVQNGATLAIQGHLADAASALSGVTGEPVHLSQLMQMPQINPLPGQTVAGGTLQTPLRAQPAPGFASGAPAMMPAVSPASGGGAILGQSGAVSDQTASPMAMTVDTLAGSGALGTLATPQGSQAGGSTQGLASVGVTGKPQKIGNCIPNDVNDIGPNDCDWSSLTAALQYYECLCAQDPNSGPFKFTYAAKVFQDGIPKVICLSDSRTCTDFGFSPTPTPGPIGGPPVPVPTPTPAPTPTPPTPTPTPPIPTPTPPPIPTPICPPGTQSVWNPAGYYTCEKIPDKITPTPTPPPLPTPDPTPTPTPPGAGGPPCGNTKQNPCWEASNPPDEDLDYFNSTPGIVVRQADKETSVGIKTPNVKIANPFGVNIQDNVEIMQNCQFSYSVNLAIDPDNVTSFIIDPDQWGEDLNEDVKQAPWGDRLMFWSWALMPISLGLLIIKVYKKVVDGIITMVGASTGAFKEIAAAETVMNALNTITFGGLRKILRVQRYGHDYKYPTGIPTPGEAGAAWLANAIDDCTFQTWVMANDTKFGPYRDIVKAGKYKFSAIELVTLDKRDKLKRSDLATRLRELGSLETTDQAELEGLFEQVPGPSDLIRFMVRDTANAQVVTDFELDTGFTTNYVDQVKKWGDQQGLTDDVMRHNWRAHWSIPSPTQLYEMLRRLRHNPQYGGPDKIQKDVIDALRQQDILPYWIPRLMEISYHPPNRSDVDRAFSLGQYDDDDYLKALYQIGYSDDDAADLLELAKLERKSSLRNAHFTKSYADGYISLDQMHDLAKADGYLPSLFDDLDMMADDRRIVAEQERQVKAIAAQYKACRITDDEAQKDMKELSIPQEVIDYQLDIASLSSLCGTKREMQSTLCALLQSGDITVSDYESRMRKLKYDEPAIQHYLTLCSNKLAASRKKAMEKAQKDAQTEAEKQAKEEDRQSEKARKAMERIQKAAEAAERARQARNRALEDAAVKLGKNLSDVSGPPAEYVQGLWQGLQSNVGLSQNEAANVINMAASKAKGMSTNEFTIWVYEMGRTGLAEPWTLYPWNQNGSQA